MKIKLNMACIFVGLFFASSSFALSILQGATSLTKTNLNILMDSSSYSYVLNKELKVSEEKIKIDDKYSIVKLSVSNLKPETDYSLKIYKGKQLIDERFFRGLDHNKTELSLLIASCLDASYEKLQSKMWKQVYGQYPEVMFLIGDNVYADKGLKAFLLKMTEKDIRDAYIRSRETLDLYRWPKLVPIYALWDDHDYGLNNQGKFFKHKEYATKIFNAFWSNEHPDLVTKGPGVSYTLRMSGIDFHFLDGRSFRDTEDTKGEHLGKGQKEWFFSQLSKSKKAMIVKGDQFFGAYHPFESFEKNHPKAFSSFVTGLKKVNISYVLVSGDRHLTEIMDLKKSSLGKSYELTTSGIHAKVFPGSFEKFPNPLMMVGKSGMYNYMLIDLDSKNELKLDIKSYGEDKKVLFSKTLKL